MKNILLLVFSIIFSLILVEAGLRITDFKGMSTFTAPCVQKTKIPGLDAELTPGCKRINSRGVEMSVNSCGFRGSEKECAMLYTSSSLVYVVGDSYTNAGSVNQEDTFVKVAERHLKGVTVLNLGVAAASLDQKIVAAKYFVEKYPAVPSAVVLQWLTNDFDASIDVSESRSVKTKIQIFLRKYFYSYRLLAYTKNKLFPIKNIPNTFLDIRKYREKEWSNDENFANVHDSLCSFSLYLNEKKIKPVFLNPPLQEMLTEWGEYVQMEKVAIRINEEAELCGWQVVWPVPSLKAFEIKDLVLDPKGDHHPNKLSNRIIGEDLGKSLEKLYELPR